MGHYFWTYSDCQAHAKQIVDKNNKSPRQKDFCEEESEKLGFIYSFALFRHPEIYLQP